MENTVLPSGEQSKIVIFSLLLMPTLLTFVGILPAFFLLFGVFMMKKSGDFSYIKTTVKIAKWYIAVMMFITLLVLLIAVGAFGNEREYHYEETVYGAVSLFAIAIFYYVVLEYLYWKPLSIRRNWVARNGIFATRDKPITSAPPANSIKIVHGERLTSLSVADELLKWAKLKEEGHISEQEYNDARTKLLQK